MIIDYVTLMLTNMVAAFVVLAAFTARYDKLEERKWAPVFLIIGLVASISGFAMSFTWPLPGPYNAAFGEPSLLLGALFIGAAISLSKDWDLSVFGYYAAIAGIVAVVLGIRLAHLQLTHTPLLTGLGFVLSGLSGISVGPYFLLRKHRWVRIVAITLLLLCALIWLRIALLAYWTHMASFGK